MKRETFDPTAAALSHLSHTCWDNMNVTIYFLIR